MDFDNITTLEQEAAQVQEWMNGVNDGVRREFGIQPVLGSKWFIVSMEWIQKWRAYVGLENSDSPAHPGAIDNSDIISQEKVLQTINEKDYNNVILKKGLVLDKDFVAIGPTPWRFLKKKYGVSGLRIKRFSIKRDMMSTKIEITLKPVRVVFVNPLDVSQSMIYKEPKVYYTSSRSKLNVIKKNLENVYRKLSMTNSLIFTRLLKLDTLEDENVILSKISKSTKKIKVEAYQLPDYTKIEKVDLADEDLVIFEAAKSGQSWRLEADSLVTCDNCDNEHLPKQMIQCNCKRKYYCDEMCLQDGKRYHACSQNINQVSQAVPELTEQSNSKRGICGLQNLGNTCFMNSGLQCLSNTFELTQYFLSNQYKDDINIDNPLGTKGKLVQQYADLVKNLWFGSHSSFAPWNFKRTLGNFASQFIGYDQHDSQELISYVLDGIHEDLNRVRVKPYVEELQTDGLSDQQMAELYWSHHISRNNSIITDLTHGQYKSEVQCPQCNKVYKKFDPFMMISVPMPEKQYKRIDVVFIPSQRNLMQQSVRLNVPKQGKVCDIIQDLRQKVNSTRDIVLVTIKNSSIKEILEEDRSVSSIKSRSMNLYAFETFDLKEGDKIMSLDFSKIFTYYGGNQRKVQTGCIRIIGIDYNLNTQEAYEFITKEVLDILRLDIQDFDEIYEKLYPNLFGEQGVEQLQLNLVNPEKSNYYSLYNNTSQVSCCPYCNEKKCTNCPLPYTTDKLLREISEQNPKQPLLKLEVVLINKSLVESLDKISRLQYHDTMMNPKKYSQQETLTSVSLKDCLDDFVSQKQLDSNNQFYCTQCQDHVQAFKKFDLNKLPKILIIHLKRFKHRDFYSSKNNILIEFPLEELDMSPFYTPEQGQSTIYDCYAVANHYGGLGGGHYTAYAKTSDNRWHHFDDSSVGSVGGDLERNIVTSAAYVLFYRRRD